MEIVSVQYSGRDKVPKVGIQWRVLQSSKPSNANLAHRQTLNMLYETLVSILSSYCLSEDKYDITFNVVSKTPYMTHGTISDSNLISFVLQKL